MTCDVRCLTCLQLRDADVWVGVVASHVYWGVWGLLQVSATAVIEGHGDDDFDTALAAFVTCDA